MVKRVLKQIVVLTCTTLLLCSCQSIKKEYRAVVPDRDVSYLDQKVTPSLAMPEGLSLQHHQDFYPLPSGPLPPPGAKPVDLTPPGLNDIAKSESPS